ncbi:MAG TPA: AAC(3) family N-acetyltransferase [Fluviicola sp.]|nr:AAC(3) family N-acetyltransferase [Fluviicola sp.]
MQSEKLTGSVYDLAAQLPLNETDTLFFSSDITRLVQFEKSQGKSFDVQRFIDSFIVCLPKGNVIFPAYNDNLKNNAVFNWNQTKPNTGALSNKAFKRKDFMRSQDPLHSVLIHGVDANHVTELNDESTFGPNSVFAFMDSKKGKMLFIDTTLNQSFTYLHYLEEKWRVSYRKYYTKKLTYIRNDKSQTKYVKFYTKKPGLMANIEKFEAHLIQKGIVKLYDFNGITLRFLNFEDINREAKEYLEKGGKFYRFEWKFLFRSIVKILLKRT